MLFVRERGQFEAHSRSEEEKGNETAAAATLFCGPRQFGRGAEERKKKREREIYGRLVEEETCVRGEPQKRTGWLPLSRPLENEKEKGRNAG